MLPYQNRLIKKGDFKLVHKYGTFYSFENITAKILKNNLDVSRIGVVIGLRFSKKAVERNWAKRMIREVTKKEISHIKKGRDIIFFVRKKAEEKPMGIDWQKSIIGVLKMARLISVKDV
jgi:ribonuclease P protein component